MRNDRPQLFILLGMLVLTAILVASVLVEKKWRGGEGWKVPGNVSRVSLLPAGSGASSGFDGAFLLTRPLDVARLPLASRFDHPLGSEHGALSYNAQGFRESRHLGDDLNGIGGWDSDFGDAVYAVAEGRVLFAGRPSDGWGKMIILGHRLADGRVIQSVYAHLESIQIAVDDDVSRGRRIGTVGKGGKNQYLAHLHFEIRETLALNPGVGYADSSLDRLSPSGFIGENRGAPPELLSPVPALERAGELLQGLEIRVEGAAGDDGNGCDGKETARELRQ